MWSNPNKQNKLAQYGETIGGERGWGEYEISQTKWQFLDIGYMLKATGRGDVNFQIIPNNHYSV